LLLDRLGQKKFEKKILSTKKNNSELPKGTKDRIQEFIEQELPKKSNGDPKWDKKQIKKLSGIKLAKDLEGNLCFIMNDGSQRFGYSIKSWDQYPLAVFSQKKRPVHKFFFNKFKYRRTKINKFLYIIRYQKILYFLAGIKLKKLSAKCKSIEDYLNLLASFRYSIFNRTPNVLLLPMQRKSEIARFCKIIAKIRPKTVLEIGTAFGGTLFLLARFSTPRALILSIDKRGNKKSYRGTLYHSFAIDKQKIIYLGGRNSHETSTLLELKKKLKNRQIDVLFIDGDHSYEGVKKDFEMYSPLVKKKWNNCIS